MKSDPRKYKVAMASSEESVTDQNVKRMIIWLKFQKTAQGSSTTTKLASTTATASKSPTESETATVRKSPLEA